ncbi:LysR family transcriptional regulator [Streptomyces sp. TRM66268-LWL]|uniref:LysR family transcriptional regulator n=1 Tax=Streptomyces polyasparticus TaxID=2767826 RepID=A0ABR7STH1_9ACTN|nr:LysR family transcriptional regulator [Streptomyces polyasparticus]MBC9718791.1 LysR family transcriptional regulator [Streptomyces polyasparticus]
MLELRQLHVLKAIAREGSLAAAARALHYSQPTITHHLAALEAHFGHRLVQRGPRGAELNELGSSLLPHAEAVLERLRLAEQEIRDLAEQGTHAVHIGTFPTAGALLLPPAVKALLQAGVRVTLSEGELPMLLKGLRARQLHAALVFSEPGEHLDLDEEFELHALLRDPLQLVLPRNHRFADRDHVPLEELENDDWIGAADPGDPCDRALSRACAKHSFQPVYTLRTDDYAVVQGFVAAGAGIALVPRLALSTPHRGVVLRQLADLPLAREVSVAALRTSAAGSIPTLVEHLRTQAHTIQRRWSD